MQVVFLELNEVNFDYLRFYADRGLLPHLGGLIRRHGVVETTSESTYEELEPWIQWVTAHTGMTFAQHGVFRLGDIEKVELTQIWEMLEDLGLRVGAVSPMNAKNRTRDAAFFVPDPWTSTRLTASPLLTRMYLAISQVVNDNAQARMSLSSLIWLLIGVTKYARRINHANYLSLLAAAHRKPWAKAMFLDLLLSDVFIREVRRARPHFSSLFLNAAAHIQHHYMFNSAAYRGEQKNPDWYVSPDHDPVREVYELYDRIVGQIQTSCRDARLMIATGLHQDPHREVTFYWRLKDHACFLRKLGIPFKRVSTRMSRDFVVECEDEQRATIAASMLVSAKDASGQRLFEVDNRGRDLFVMLTWPHDIGSEFVYVANDRQFVGFRDDVAFVAIKNGHHHGTGYFVDTGMLTGSLNSFPLAEIPLRVCDALGVRSQTSVIASAVGPKRAARVVPQY